MKHIYTFCSVLILMGALNLDAQGRGSSRGGRAHVAGRLHRQASRPRSPLIAQTDRHHRRDGQRHHRDNRWRHKHHQRNLYRTSLYIPSVYTSYASLTPLDDPLYLDSQKETYWNVSNNSRHLITFRPEKDNLHDIKAGEQNASIAHEYGFEFTVSTPDGQYRDHISSDHFIFINENDAGAIFIETKP